MTLDTAVEADILSTCNALGSEIKGVYEKGVDCIECLKDLLRHLRRDTEDYCILRYLGSVRLLQTDLVPILKRYNKDNEIFDFALRILVALTNPALLLYKEDLPDDKISRNVYLQIISYLQSYKKAFVDADIWKVLYEHLKELLKSRPVERSTNENVLLERIIILIRNVLHVPPDESILKQTDDDLSLHDKILLSLHESKLDLLILYMSANEDEHQYCLHVLEIVSLMLREHMAETLANSNEVRSDVEKQKDLDILLAARQREKNLKLQKNLSFCSSRFNGVYCVKNMKSLSDKDYIAHKLINNVEDLKFDLQKTARRKPKNRVRAPDIDSTRHSTISIRLFLKKFCIEFLTTYNKLMVSVKRELIRKLNDEHDETYYLWAVCYFMQFNRLHEFQPALVSETISTQTFHHIQTEITNYHEMMLTDKKKTLFWAKRMQLGVSAYKELLETLKKMERSDNEAVRNSGDALISHVFYVIEYREMLFSLLSSYDEVKFPLSYLAELVESTQLFLKILENHSKRHSEIIVQKKQRKVRRKKKKKPAAVPNESVNEEDQLNQQWDAVTSELSAAVQGRRPIPNVTPFDGASELTFEEQKVEAVYQIREALIANEPWKALGLLRAARELWPEGDSFGNAVIEPEPEFLVLREIHFSNLKRTVENPSLEVEEDSNEEDDDDDEELESMPAVAEQKLDLSEVYKRYASHKVVQPCSLLLANYRSNKPQTNTCVIKLLHRIAWNCKMHALFFQSTIFLTFQKIFHDPDVKHDPVIKEFYRFARFIIGKFFSAAEKNSKIFVEFLFWKGSKEAYELEEGYGTSESKVKGWTEDEEEELKYIFEENKDIYIEGQDVADIVLANFNQRNRTKVQIISALKRLGLIKTVKDLKPAQRTEWTEAEVIELQDFFEDYKSSDDVMSNILGKLSVKRSRKAVVDKLMELNLIQDRKEVRKKGSRKKKSGNGDSDGNSSDENDEHLDDTYNEAERSERDHIHSESDDENEKMFFRNLEAERFAEDNSTNNDMSMNGDNSTPLVVKDSQAKQKKKKAPIDVKRQNKKLSKIWEEQEIMELTSLFHTHSGSDDIMHILLNALTVKRPKQAVIEKLLELGLIKDKKEIRKKRASKSKKDTVNDKSEHSEIDDSNDLEIFSNEKRSSENKRMKRHVLSDSSDEDIPLSHSSLITDSEGNKNIVEKPKIKKSEVWEEQEIIKLNELFTEYKESNDVIGDILKKLTIKKTRKSVTEKLLEIRLIKDKKEIRKKRSSKSKNDTVNDESEHSEIDDSNDLEIFSNEKRSSENKRMKRRVLSDSSDEDIPLNHISLITDSEGNKNILEKPKIKKPEVWEEQEIIKLNELFTEHKESNDVIGDILKKLTTKKTRKSVIEKLLEIRLIKDKKELKKNIVGKIKKKKPSDLWEEHEIIKLNKLYQEAQDSSDIIAYILDGLIVKRSKQNVIGKLLEIGLIKDKKELRKKRTSKIIKNKNSSYNAYSDEDDINDKNMNARKMKKKMILSDSSDDEDLPLNSVISSSANNVRDDSDNSVAEISFENTQQNEIPISVDSRVQQHEILDSQNFLKINSSQEISRKIDVSMGFNKRKRVLISDDSSDDDSRVTKEVSDNSMVDFIADNTEANSNDNAKMQKKKLRVLDDSDDSE